MATPQKPTEPLPYYKWYWRDWRASRAVQKMTPLERGIYRELLDEQWKSGALVNDPKWLAEAAMCSEDELATVWRTLSDCFPPIQGSGGELLANERLEAERTGTDIKRAAASRSGRLGGLSKANAKRPPSERHIAVAEQSKAVSEHSDRQANASPDGARSLSDEPIPDWRDILRNGGNGPLTRLTNPNDRA